MGLISALVALEFKMESLKLTCTGLDANLIKKEGPIN